MLITKKKITIIALAVVSLLSMAFGSLLLSANTVKADNRTDEEILHDALSKREVKALTVGDSIADKWLLVVLPANFTNTEIELTDSDAKITLRYELCDDTQKILPMLKHVKDDVPISVATASYATTYNDLTAFYILIHSGTRMFRDSDYNHYRYELTAENVITSIGTGASIYIVIEEEPTTFIQALSEQEKTPVTSNTVINDKWLCYNPDSAASYIYLNNNAQIYVNVNSANQRYTLTVLNPNDKTDAVYPYKGSFYKDTRYVDTEGYYIYFQIPSGTYTGTFADGTECSYLLDSSSRIATAQGVLYELNAEDIVEPEPERPDPGAGVPGLARYEKHYISGQYWRVYGPRTVACDSNMRLEMSCIAGTDKLTLFTSGSENKVQVGLDKNKIIQNQEKDEYGRVIYTDFYMPETIVSTTGNYLTSNLVIHSDYVDYIYLITDPQTVCPTVYSQVNITPEEPGQSPTLPGEPNFPSTEDPSNPGTDDPSNPVTDIVIEESKFGDILKDGLLELTDWFNDYTGLGLSSSIVGLAIVIIIILILRKRR